jgi:hypothetical protein
MQQLKITEYDTKQDIRTYAKVWSLKIQAKFDMSQKRQRYIEDVITEKAEGTKPICALAFG